MVLEWLSGYRKGFSGTLVLLAAGGILPLPAQVVDTSTKPKVIIKVVTPPPPPTDTALFHVGPKDALLIHLAAEARLATADTLFVYSPSYRDLGKYEGVAIDTTFYPLFQPFYPELAFPHAEPELFVTYRLSLAKARTAYLLRVPGMYDPTAIDLWVYDARQKRFAAPIRIAEAYGDEGYVQELVGWLVDLNHDGHVDLVLRKRTSDTEMETGKVRSESDSLWLRLWTDGGFAKPRVASDPHLRLVFDPQKWQNRR